MDQYLKGTTTWGPKLQDVYMKVSYDSAADRTYADQKIIRVTKVDCGLYYSEDGDVVNQVVAMLKNNGFQDCSQADYDAQKCTVYSK
jgi:hypothetical protein